MTVLIPQAVAETMQSPDVTMVSAVAGIVALGKVWDKVVGRGRDKAARDRERAIAERLEEHAAQDVQSFAAIHTSLAVLEAGMGTVTKTLDTIDRRMYDAQGER